MGAGAAGIMAAIFAARHGADVVLLERTVDGGRKILISGGGRCNILPARVDEARFVTDSSPNTLRKIVRSWPLAEQVDFFNGELGLALRGGDRIREALPCLEPRPRRARRTDRPRHARGRTLSRRHERYGSAAGSSWTDGE